MIIVLKANADDRAIEDVKEHIVGLGYEPRVIRGVERTVIGAVGDELSHRSLESLKAMEVVENVLPIQKRFKLASRQYHKEDSVVNVGMLPVGHDDFQVIAGPCSVENRKQLRSTVESLVGCGVRIVRGGAFKPRTSPYDFQGLGQEGLDLLAEVKKDFGVMITTELLSTKDVEAVAAVADLIQIGARNCQNYDLLQEAGQAGKPVLLKRGMATKIEEWISAAEYLMVNGCPDVLLCERGIRTFETSMRNTLDVGAIAMAKRETHLPVVVDPSHAAGTRDMVLPLALAGIAAGADGIIVESHCDPAEAMSDGPQQLRADNFQVFMDAVKAMAQHMGKHIGREKAQAA